MTKFSEIQSFLQPKKLAIAGVSRNKKKFGYAVFKELRSKGFDIYPINPNADEIDGVKCYPDVTSLPSGITHIHIVTPKAETESIVKQSLEKGILNIWIQQSSDTPEAVKMAMDGNASLIHKKCILMYAEPVKGIHGFHRFLAKFFGAYPK